MPASALAERPPSSTPLKVLYVMGAGRSGSTILGVALGNCDGVFFAGELDKWLARRGVPRRKDAARARFWEAVLARMDGAEDLFGHDAQRCLERSSALFRIRDWPTRRWLRERYRPVSRDLYEAIADVAGTRSIVDTSHYPLRARELQGVDGIELHLVLLVRDPRSVVASFARRDVDERGFGTLTTNAYLWLTYLLSLVVFLRHRRDRRLFVRYEQLVEDPHAVLEQILALIDCSATVPDLTALRTGVPFHGNRLLGTSEIAMSGRAGPAEGRSRRARVTAALQLPLALVFARLRPAVSTLSPAGQARRPGETVTRTPVSPGR